MTKYAAALLIAAVTLTAPQAQSLEPITAEDMLKVTTAQVLDLSEDGRFVAVGARRLHDNAETNHRRYGDGGATRDQHELRRRRQGRQGADERAPGGVYP
jgi:hypothetical protein